MRQASALTDSIAISTHAAQRAQQRGIRPATLQLLRLYGHRRFDHHGAVRLLFDHAARRRIATVLGTAAAGEVQYSVYAVVRQADGTLISVAHRHGRRQREQC